MFWVSWEADTLKLARISQPPLTREHFIETLIVEEGSGIHLGSDLWFTVDLVANAFL